MKKNKRYLSLILLLTIAFIPNIVFAANCPLGPDVTKDLAGALKIVKILAPILILGYTAYEGIHALIKQQIDTEGKKLFTKFVKRVVAAAILFVIPILVDVIMQAMDVWDEGGYCSFDGTVEVSGKDGGEVTVDPSRVKTISTEPTDISREVDTSIALPEGRVDSADGSIPTDRNSDASGQLPDGDNSVRVDASTSPIRIDIN